MRHDGFPEGFVAVGDRVVAMARKMKRESGDTHPSGLVVRGASLDRARPFRWAWNQRVLMGYLNLQIGEEGVGKGNLTAWQAARISKGELDGDLKGTPRTVLFVGDEDSWDHIWTPRLAAAGADLDRVKVIEAGTKGGVLDVKEDADALAELIRDEEVGLVYFDQLLDNLGYTDNWKDKEVRDKLAPIRRVAQETDVAILASMHPNKRGGSFRDRISGTPAFNALSRSSLLVAPHPQEPGRVAVARAKGNYSAEPPAFEFRIEEHVLSVVADGVQRSLTASRITALRETGLRREDLLEAPSGRGRAESDAGQARSKLSQIFADSRSRLASEVIADMAAEGFAERVTQKARRDLGLKTWQVGFQGPHYWGYKTDAKVRVRRGKAAGGGVSNAEIPAVRARKR